MYNLYLTKDFQVVPRNKYKQEDMLYLNKYQQIKLIESFNNSFFLNYIIPYKDRTGFLRLYKQLDKLENINEEELNNYLITLIKQDLIKIKTLVTFYRIENTKHFTRMDINFTTQGVYITLYCSSNVLKHKVRNRGITVLQGIKNIFKNL